MALKRKKKEKPAVKKKLVKRKVSRAVKKKAVKKAVVRKAVVRKAVVRKAVVRKAAVRKAAVRKAVVRKAVVRKAVVKKAARKKIKENIIGTVTHYFPKVRAGVIKLKKPLAVGDVIKIKGHTTDFTQAVKSIQIDHVSLDNAKKGDEIGLLVNSRVRRHDAVYKVR
jgi:hypothetical protein